MKPRHEQRPSHRYNQNRNHYQYPDHWSPAFQSHVRQIRSLIHLWLKERGLTEDTLK